ncbi:MAG TPA: hypothetical protein VJS92_00435, partial [Candidatus Polarisedimenticolaceae bacterium]|nr:hypothetical protein [Candidatus Polarisedimenticolaceae bacterium]
MRYLRDQARPVASVPMARELLATATADEGTARLLLETAFAGDARLVCTEEGWRLSASAPRPARPTVEPDRVLLVLEGERPPGRRQP